MLFKPTGALAYANLLVYVWLFIVTRNSELGLTLLARTCTGVSRCLFETANCKLSNSVVYFYKTRNSELKAALHAALRVNSRKAMYMTMTFFRGGAAATSTLHASPSV